MRMFRLGVRIAVLTLAAAVAPSVVRADVASVVAAAYGDLSISAPTRDQFTVCHGFGCRYRVELGLTDADHAALAKILAAGKASAAGERKAIAAAGAWFDRRIAPIAGTKGHVARANRDYMFDRGQFDCIDTSRNLTGLLLVLQQLDLLKHHEVAAPESRGYMIDLRPLHATAVLVETASGTKWSVDAWTRAYGQAPEIMTLARWSKLD